MESTVRWVLAFDGSCGRCRRISEIVEAAASGRLEVRPLADPDVRRWREQALGPVAPWAPTLLEVEAGRVRARTGARLGVRLVRRLGARYTVRVLRALGRLQAESRDAVENDGLRRRGLLRLGIGVGVGLMVSGTAPAFAASEPQKLAAARAWARANRTPRLGQYDELAGFEPAYRRIVFGDLAPAVRRTLWSEQLDRFRAAHPELTAEQARVLDRACALLADPALFDGPGPELRRRVEEFEASANRAFGRGRACGLFSTLGPAHGTTSDPQPMDACGCSVGSVCDGGGCTGGPCTIVDPGCGCFLAWPCDGCYGCVR